METMARRWQANNVSMTGKRKYSVNLLEFPTETFKNMLLKVIVYSGATSFVLLFVNVAGKLTLPFKVFLRLDNFDPLVIAFGSTRLVVFLSATLLSVAFFSIFRPTRLE